MPEFLLLNDMPWLAILFFGVAALYSAAGFGGGSSYIAALSLASAAPVQLRSVAYLCNIIVSGFGARRFAKRGVLDLRLALPFLVASVPMAMLGSALRPDVATFKLILAAVLLPAGLLLVFSGWMGQRQAPRWAAWVHARYGLYALSALIGFVSGLVGIGGGVFLAPVLHFARWRTAVEIAALSSLYIAINSLAGFAVLLAVDHSTHWLPDAAVLALVVYVGMRVGNGFALSERGRSRIRTITGVLVVVAAVVVFARYLAEKAA